MIIKLLGRVSPFARICKFKENERRLSGDVKMYILGLLAALIFVCSSIIGFKKLAALRADLIRRKEELSEFKSLYIGYLAGFCYTLAFTYCNSIDMIVSNFDREIYYVVLNLF